MKNENLSILFGEEETFNNWPTREAKFFQEPYSESEVLELQNIFLSTGYHTIEVQTLAQGRRLIAVYLQSLYYYHSPGCLTASGPVPSEVIDLFKMLQDQTAEKFLYEQAQIDFLWIEIPHNNIHQAAFTLFMNTCRKLQLEKQMPVVTLRFKCNL